MAFRCLRIPLDQDWQFKADDESEACWRKAAPPPTTIHQDLLAKGLIPDPFSVKDEELVQWAGRKIWIYRAHFAVPEASSYGKHTVKELIFEGLPTYATVSFNSIQILQAENMFVTYRVDVSSIIRLDNEPNVLEIAFANTAQPKLEEVARDADYEMEKDDDDNAQYPHYEDWGPKLTTCGPWRPIFLEVSESRVTGVATRSFLNADHQEVTLEVSVEVAGPAKHAIIHVKRNGTLITTTSLDVQESSPSTAAFKISKPDLWWPHTLGEPSMYEIAVILHADEHNAHEIYDSVSKRIGIRQVELGRSASAGQEEGNPFFFRVNGLPISPVGSDWVPADCSAPRVSIAGFRQTVELARESNQVLIRVGRGSIYESEEFYNACDELGILVWQDFMFAANESSVLEATDNIRRLRHHPCIALWCGDDEDDAIALESGIADYTSQTYESTSSQFIYRRLPSICKKLVPDTPYCPHSPSGRDQANKRARSSSFGLQSIPSLRTVRHFFPHQTDPFQIRDDWTQDPYIQSHNKCLNGAEILYKSCEDNLPFDANAKRSLKRLIYCTQLVQSEEVRNTYQAWRRRRHQQQERAMPLIWPHFNDSRPCTSPSLADSFGRKKMAYWSMKRENAPITAGITRTKEGQLEVWGANTSTQDVELDVQLRAWNVRGGKPLWEKTLAQEVVLASNQSAELGTQDLLTLDLPVSGDGSYTDVVFAVDLLRPSSGERLARAIDFHQPLKEVEFSLPSEFTARIVTEEEGKTFLTLKSSCALKGVLVEILDTEDDKDADGVQFDDNGFDMLPDETVKIGVSGLREGEEHRLSFYEWGMEWTV